MPDVITFEGVEGVIKDHKKFDDLFITAVFDDIIAQFNDLIIENATQLSSVLHNYQSKLGGFTIDLSETKEQVCEDNDLVIANGYLATNGHRLLTSAIWSADARIKDQHWDVRIADKYESNHVYTVSFFLKAIPIQFKSK